MALIKRADLDTFARNAIVLNLGDIALQGEQLKTDAQTEAQELVTEGELTRDRIRANAAQQGRMEGFARGMIDGRAEGHKEGKAEAKEEFAAKLEQLESSWRAALGDFEQTREAMLTEAKQDVLRLGLMIAEKITKRVVQFDSEVVCSQMEAVLSLLANPTKLVIAVHPDDEQLAADFLPDLLRQYTNALHADLVADDSLTRGSCVVRTGSGGMIDASIRTQLDRIVERLLPGAAADVVETEEIEEADDQTPPPQSPDEVDQ